MMRRVETGLAGDVGEGINQTLFQVTGYGDVRYLATAMTDEMVVVLGEVFRQLPAGVVAGGDDSVDDASPFEDREIAISGRLGQSRGSFKELRNCQGGIRRQEHVDEGASLRRVTLAVEAQSPADDAVNLVGHVVSSSPVVILVGFRVMGII